MACVEIIVVVLGDFLYNVMTWNYDFVKKKLKLLKVTLTTSEVGLKANIFKVTH